MCLGCQVKELPNIWCHMGSHSYSVTKQGSCSVFLCFGSIWLSGCALWIFWPGIRACSDGMPGHRGVVLSLDLLKLGQVILVADSPICIKQYVFCLFSALFGYSPSGSAGLSNKAFPGSDLDKFSISPDSNLSFAALPFVGLNRSELPTSHGIGRVSGDAH